MASTGKHRAFIVEIFLTNGKSITATLRNFRNHFQLSRHDPVSNRKNLLLWVKNFRATGSADKRKPLEDQEAFELQRISKLLKSPFCDVQEIELVSILLHLVFLFAV